LFGKLKEKIRDFLEEQHIDKKILGKRVTGSDLEYRDFVKKKLNVKD